jgi:acyl carrier protein
MSSLEQQLRTYIAENVTFTDHFAHPDDASFLENGILDSMNVMELVLHTEQTYGIRIEDSDITPANFDSIVRIADFVRRKTNPSTPPPAVAQTRH